MANDRKIIVAVDLYGVPVTSVMKFEIELIDSLVAPPSLALLGRRLVK